MGYVTLPSGIESDGELLYRAFLFPLENFGRVLFLTRGRVVSIT